MSATATIEFNPFLPEVIRDPYPVYARLRAEDPVHFSEKIKSFVITRYDDVRRLLLDEEERLSADRTTADKYRGPRSEVRSLMSDPPGGRAVRNILTQHLNGRTGMGWAMRIVELVDELLDDAAHKVDELLDGMAAGSGQLDLIADFAYQLPVLLIAEMFGIPEEDRARFSQWSNDLTRASDHTFAGSPVSSSIAEFQQYLFAMVTDRFANPGSDMLSRLATTELDGERLNEIELMGLAGTLLFAGHETTVNLIGNGLNALLRDPAQRDLVASGSDEDVRLAIEEFLRFDSPSQVLTRIATSDFELHGQPIRVGQTLMTVLGAANRDPEVFEDPDVLDVTRSANAHMAFGFGAHYCLGAALSRREGQIAVPALLRRFPNMTLAADEPRYRSSFVLRGLEELPVNVNR